MNRYIALIVFTLTTLFLALASTHIHASELKPLVVVIEKVGSKTVYRVNGKRTPMPMMLDATGEYLHPNDHKGLKTNVFVLSDSRISLDKTKNMTGVLGKVGFQNIRYFSFNKESRKMRETKFVGPVVPFTTDPATLARIKEQ